MVRTTISKVYNFSHLYAFLVLISSHSVDFNFCELSIVPHVENVPNRNILSVSIIFKCNPGETNDEFVASRSFLSGEWYHTDEFERKRNRRIAVYGSVTRYGPRTSCQRNGLINALDQTPPSNNVHNLSENAAKAKRFYLKFTILMELYYQRVLP